MAGSTRATTSSRRAARPAVATVAGTVVQTVGQLGGNQVKLFGDDGVGYYYTHLDSFGAEGTGERRAR